MRALIIDENSRKEIARVKAYAEENKYPKMLMIAAMKGNLKPIGDNPGHVCKIEVGYRAVYSIEEQPFGWCHHLSVSVNDPEKCPSIPSVEVLMQEFGFTEKSVKDCASVWLEDGLKPTPVNVVGKISP